jgi:hypothetical protein
MQKKVRLMRAVDYSEWPKPTPSRGTGLVACIKGDFDAIAASLAARPKVFTQRATKTCPQIKYRCVFLILSNGAPAFLAEFVGKAGTFELNLQVERDCFAFDDDYAEVIAGLGVSHDQVQKFDGNFTWLANRKAKRIEPEDDLPDDWWNHVRVLPPSKDDF